ncbi:hypothetical protein SDC9_150374 [bioreactor metagenome]|uniref:Uncharacterized protein n=1 Tax=bioreactor metagenome TaxID=1076179 RepID=A0A645EMB2_9ZZZZ
MILEHLFNVHLIDMVGSKDANPVCVKKGHQMEVLEYRIGSSLVPALSVPHLSRHDIDEKVAAAECASKLPSLSYVFMK